MNLLLEDFPTKVVIGGAEFEINSGFRASILFSQLMESNLDDNFKIQYTLQYYFNDDDILYFLNNNLIDECFEKIMWFYLCGEDTKTNVDIPEKECEKDFDFEMDSSLIYAAFMQVYHIDLQTEKDMHWWKFKSLLNGLTDDTTFSKVRDIRTRDISDLKGKEKDAAIRAKKMFKIKSDEEKEFEKYERELMEAQLYGKSSSGKTLEELLSERRW